MPTTRFIKGLLLLISIFALLVGSGQSAPGLQGDGSIPVSSEQPRNVILISWDGLDRSVVLELLQESRLPNLAALIDEGSFQEIEVVGHVTATKPGHAEMLTGLGPDVTGVVSNLIFQPIPEGLTIFERLQEHFGGPENIRTVFVSSKVAHVGGRGPEVTQAWLENQFSRNGRRQVEGIPVADLIAQNRGEPFYLTRNHLDVFDSATREASETGPLCLSYLSEYSEPRFIAFFHFSDPDTAGHQNGIDSEEYREAAHECDYWLGRMMSLLRKLGLSDSTLIYVAADHGFDEHSTRHRNAPHSWLATNDPLVTHGGTLADIPATILARFGVDVASLEPPLIGAPLTSPVAVAD